MAMTDLIHTHTFGLVDALYLQTILPAKTSREEGKEMKYSKMVTLPKEIHHTKFRSIYTAYLQKCYLH